MAVSVINAAVGLFDPYTRDKASVAEVIRLATFGKAKFPKGTALASQDGATVSADILAINKQIRTAQIMLGRLFGRRGADFKGVFDTSDNAALAEAFDLNDLGVTFPAATLRTITLTMVSTNDAESIRQVIEQDVWGNDGVTPKLGDARLVDAFKVLSGTYAKLGRVHYRGVLDVEDTTGMNSSGTALAAFSSGNAALTFPLSRAMKVIGSNVAGSDATLPNNRSIRVQAPNATAGTAAVLTASEGATDALADPAATSVVEVELELWPQAQVQLVMNSTHVEVHLRTTVVDVYRHRIEAFIGPAITNALSA